MNLEKYEYLADEDYKSFMFLSQGPRGEIKKVINYRPLVMLPDGLPVINLGFGDWDEARNDIDDSAASNNNDRDKILATVASTVLTFTQVHGKVLVYAEGSTPAKTRLYQMGINAHFSEVEALFEVYGQLKGKWVKFERGVNYEAFLVVRK